jgi:hypothetical protein
MYVLMTGYHFFPLGPQTASSFFLLDVRNAVYADDYSPSARRFTLPRKDLDAVLAIFVSCARPYGKLLYVIRI